MANKSRFNVALKALHQGVTGSCIHAYISYPNGDRNQILIDCGLFQEPEYSSQNEVIPLYVEEIDCALITHNHVDHNGRVPILVKNGFSAPIYTSKTNLSLMPIALYDNCRVLRDLSKTRKTKCVYNESDVEKTLKLCYPCNWGVTVNFNEHIRYTFFKNGHLLGASVILMQISYPDYEDINLLFTGDYNGENIFFTVSNLPEWVLNLPITIVCEATYGNRNSSDVSNCFDSNIINALKNGASVIAPVFSQGRSQEVMYRIKCLQENGTLSTDIPVYYDGNLGIKYNEIYKSCPDILPNMRDFFPHNFTYVDKDLRDVLVQSNTSKVILTSSGMGSYGPAQTYLPEYITRKNALIHFTGYCAPDTLGYELKNTSNGNPVKIGGRMILKSAQVEFTSEFSAHAKADELVSFLNKFSQLKMVLINHGEPEVKETFAARVLSECHAKSVGILGNGYTFRVDRYGFVKSIPCIEF